MLSAIALMFSSKPMVGNNYIQAIQTTIYLLGHTLGKNINNCN